MIWAESRVYIRIMKALVTAHVRLTMYACDLSIAELKVSNSAGGMVTFSYVSFVL
jgi:hypothetical protein